MPRRSTSIRWLSVPPEHQPEAAPHEAVGERLRVGDDLPLVGAGTRASAPRANATALAAMTCISGPPWLPGKTDVLSAFACASRHRISPPRGPRSVLCVVVVTKSQCGTGDGCTPGRDQAGDVRHVGHQQSRRPRRRSRGTARSRSRADRREWPTTIIFGRCARARSRDLVEVDPAVATRARRRARP